MPADRSSLFDALNALVQADRTNSNKGKAVKEWFAQNFKAEARASLVTESKQAYNRPKEQLGSRNAAHVVFVYVEDGSLRPLVETCKKIAYPGLRTVIFFKQEGPSNYAPKKLLVNGDSEVRAFYAHEFPALPTEEFVFAVTSEPRPAYSGIEDSELGDDDPIFTKVRALLDDGFAGVLLTGPPGTGKSWYARKIAAKLVDDDSTRTFFVQFHPGYQYEDFVESFAPSHKGGFELVDRTFLVACSKAETSKKDVVLVIDEVSRTDAVRVFGEALTYLERSKRGLPFSLASGRTITVPSEIVVLGTMNPWDRGVDDLDLAFERRFAKVNIEPSVEGLRKMLASAAISEEIQRKLERFFLMTSHHPNLACRIGHAYFVNVRTEDSLKRLWECQLHPHFSKVLRNDAADLERLVSMWSQIFDA
jgi:hypothetical protein